MKRYLYRVELLSEPEPDVRIGRLVYMSLSGAQYRASVLRERGVDVAIERSDLIAWVRDGFITVKLPPLAGVAGSGNGVWLESPRVEQRFDGEVVISDRLAIAANELRTVAAALLAAAAQHEQDGAE